MTQRLMGLRLAFKVDIFSFMPKNTVKWGGEIIVIKKNQIKVHPVHGLPIFRVVT